MRIPTPFAAERLTSRAFPLVLTALLSTAGAFYYTAGASADNPTATATPAPTVEVTELTPTAIRTWTRFSGRLTPVASAEIKPLVGGTIEQVLFVDGQFVQKGDPLFVIDPRPHEAQLQRAEAELATARSRERLTKDELERARQLLEGKLISRSIFDTATSDHQVAQASVKAAESAVNQARLNVEYAYIRAPISGRAGRAELTVGNVVGAGASAPVLTTIVADDRLYAEFNVDEQTYIRSVRSIQQQEEMPVELTLASDESRTYRGHIHAFDNRLDVASGTIRARAIFTNTDGALTPGMYANISLGSAATQAALLVPDRAIGTNQNRKFVYVVDGQNTVQYREVALGNHFQAHRVVVSGVEAGERIAVNSLSHLRPSAVVNPVSVTTLNNQLAVQ
ncbi:MAG: efflux RND transporter periplasmic adaptor subunit [Cellvibrionaceae bacterium]|nr:efflux RND transporter periplasmic adaptor subunit [Cellvibrionaceae bacterium]